MEGGKKREEGREERRGQGHRRRREDAPVLHLVRDLAAEPDDLHLLPDQFQCPSQPVHVFEILSPKSRLPLPPSLPFALPPFLPPSLPTWPPDEVPPTAVALLPTGRSNE
jgi:hypothetical protein